MSNENMNVENAVVEEIEEMEFEQDENGNMVPVIAVTAGIAAAIIGVGTLVGKKVVKPGVGKIKGALAERRAKKEVVIVFEPEETTDAKKDGKN